MLENIEYALNEINLTLNELLNLVGAPNNEVLCRIEQAIRQQKKEVRNVATWHKDTVLDIYRCSNCLRHSVSNYHFCPWCGAEMQGVVEK